MTAPQIRRTDAASFRYTPPDGTTTSEARAVLDDILEKYIEYGTAQFQIPEILKVPPISHRGTVMEIAGMFGGEVRDYSILGDTVNLAQRLESVAPPGETYVGELTYGLTRGRFDFAPLGELTLKGKERSVRGWRLLGERVEQAEEAAARGGVRSLVGRERELATVSHLVEGVSEGRGALLLVTGDAGIGKSRLVEEVRRRDSAVRWLGGHCVSYGARLPYWPFVDLLRRALQGEAAGSIVVFYPTPRTRPSHWRAMAAGHRIGVTVPCSRRDEP